MRDAAFIEDFVRLTPKLERLFSKVVRTFNGGDLATEVDDLVQDTGTQALENSRLPQYKDFTCETLIFLKAYNKVYEYCHPPQKRVPALPIEKALNKSSADDPFRDVINKEWLEDVYKKVDRATWVICYLTYAGYKQEEIAGHMRMSVAAVKMKLQRARQKPE